MAGFLTLDLTERDRVSPGVNANCEVADNGKYYYIETSNLDSKTLYTYQPIHKDKNIKKIRDGIYAYIIASTEKEEEKIKIPHIYAIRTLTIHEIKTKHAHLVNRLTKPSSKNNNKGIRYLHYAGEFLKQGNSISFNFMSGTYMADNIQIKHDRDVITNAVHINHVKSIFKEYTSINAQFTVESLINKSHLTLTKRDIDTLVNYGAYVYEYDDHDECEYKVNYKGLHARQLAQHNQKMRVFERTNKETEKPPPIFVKPRSPLQGNLLQPIETPMMLGKRKRSSNQTVSSSQTGYFTETHSHTRKKRKTVYSSTNTRRNTLTVNRKQNIKPYTV